MPTPPPWWIGHPRGAARGVQQRVQQRPVGDRVRAVLHRLGLAVGRATEPRVEVVAADDDRRLRVAARTISLNARPSRWRCRAQPADARRQALELDALARHVEPAVQVRVVRDQFLHLVVGALDVPGCPTARPSGTGPTPRQNSGRMYAGTKPGKSNAFFTPAVECDLADVVAVVEHRDARAGTASIASTCFAIDARDASTARGSLSRRPPARASSPRADSRSPGRAPRSGR